MTRISLSNELMGKLHSESSGSGSVYLQLCRESIVRQWLKSCGIPSWRNPLPPSENIIEPSYLKSRYSIMLADGSRFLVCPCRNTVLWLDMAAAAKSFAALAVELDENGEEGFIAGCIFLRNIPQSPRSFDFASEGLESSATFLHYLKRPVNYTFTLIIFSIRLLLFGEPDAPERGTEEVKVFCPV